MGRYIGIKNKITLRGRSKVDPVTGKPSSKKDAIASNTWYKIKQRLNK